MTIKRRGQSGGASMQERPRALDSPYLTAQECIEYLRIGSRTALYRLIHEHRLPYGRVGRSYRFHRARLDTWVEGQAGALRDLQRSA